MKDYYYILGIDKNASLDEIEEAYHKLWSKFHPAKNNRDPYFENLFYDVREAFQHLSNPILRKEYDEKHKSFFDEDVPLQHLVKEDPIHPKDPVIKDFKADKDSVYEGDTIKITWQTEHADKVTISCFRGEQEPAGNKMHTVTGIRDREVIPLTIKATNSVTNESVDKRITIDSQLHIDIKNKVAGISPGPKENKEEVKEVVAPQKIKEDKKESTQKKEEKSQSKETKAQDKKASTAFQDKENKTNSKTTTEKRQKNRRIGGGDKLMLMFIIATIAIIIIMGIINQKPRARNFRPTITETKKVKKKHATAEKAYNKDENEDILRNATTPENVLKLFFSYINHGNYRGAYWLSDNEIWKPFKKFSEEAWSNFKDIKPVSIHEKEYQSEYGADKIIEATLHTYDVSKRKNIKVTYDFHLKMNYAEKKWQIVRMTFPKKIDTWYYDDPLYEYKFDEKLLEYNKTYALLQGYYDNFSSKELVEDNAEYYSDVLVIHHADELITRSRALTKDYEDFIKNDIESYQILVDVVNLKVDQYEKFDFVSAPLNYYVTKTNGDRSKFTLDNVVFVTNKESSLIYAIGRDYSVDDFLEVLRNYSN